MSRAAALVLLFVWGCGESSVPPGVGGRPKDMGPTCSPSAEICNGVDDDCDRLVDEAPQDVGAACGVGACGGGVTVCADGALACDSPTAPTDEICNGVDDDCDETVDEEAARGAGDDSPLVGQACDHCPAAVYICAEGTLRCEAAIDEVCDGADNDCDGNIDETFPGAGAACGMDVGLCVAGTQACIGGALTCGGAVAPVDEACDDADNDCDGAVDEGLMACEVVDLPCTTHDECATGLCFNDQGLLYCSRACDLEADDCGDGYRCEARDNQTVCTRIFPTCEAECPGAGCIANCGCDATSICTLGPLRDPTRIVRECRPPTVVGRPAGAPCTGAVDCASGYCPGGAGRCSRACCRQEDCGPDLVCVLSPFRSRSEARFDVGLCLPACTGDAQCAGIEGDPICRYRGDPEEMEYRGACTQANSQGVGLGDPCEFGQQCRHGLCFVPDESDGYCIRGCANETDCPEGWSCNETGIGPRMIRICQP